MKLKADLKGTLVIPSSVEKLEEGILQDKNEIKRLVFNNKITVVPSKIFEGCEKLEEIRFPFGSPCCLIEEGAFRACKKLIKISFSASLQGIAPYAFQDCESLEKVYIPVQTQAVGTYAFKNCYSLKSFTLGSVQTKIGSKALNGCKSLQKFKAGEKEWDCLPFFSFPSLVLSSHCGAGCRFYRLQWLRGFSGGEVIGPKVYTCVGNNGSQGEGYTFRDSYTDFLFNSECKPKRQELRAKCNASTLISVNEFRMLSGSCYFGTDFFCIARKIDPEKDKLTIREVAKMLEGIENPESVVEDFVEWAHGLPDFNA